MKSKEEGSEKSVEPGIVPDRHREMRHRLHRDGMQGKKVKSCMNAAMLVWWMRCVCFWKSWA